MKNIFVKYLTEKTGAAAIEAALVLPIILLLLGGMTELGVYFWRSQIINRGFTVTSSAVQNNPSDPNNLNTAMQTGAGIIDVASAPNFFCAQSYTSQAAATALGCSGTTWETTPPVGLPSGGPYYVAMRTKVVSPSFFPGLSGVLPDIEYSSVIPINSSNGTLPTCAPGEVVTSNGTALTCVNPAQNFKQISSIDVGTCQVRSNITGPGVTSPNLPSYSPYLWSGGASCNADEIAIGFGAQTEVPGVGFCSEQPSFLTSAFPMTVRDYGADSFQPDWVNDACIKSYIVCCKITTQYGPP
jgi:Flp pilus assembly protein TadG